MTNLIENLVYDRDGLPDDFVRRVARLRITDERRRASTGGIHPGLRQTPTALALNVVVDAMGECLLPLGEILSTLGVTGHVLAAAMNRVGVEPPTELFEPR